MSIQDPEQMCKSILEDVVNNIFNENTNKDESSIFGEKQKVNAEHQVELDDSSVTWHTSIWWLSVWKEVYNRV